WLKPFCRYASLARLKVCPSRVIGTRLEVAIVHRWRCSRFRVSRTITSPVTRATHLVVAHVPARRAGRPSFTLSQLLPLRGCQDQPQLQTHLRHCAHELAAGLDDPFD